MIPVQSGYIKLQGAANCCRGGRPENQDDWLSLDTPLGFLLIVCDGMGGGPGGKTASGLVKQAVTNCFMSSNNMASPADVMTTAVSLAEKALEEKMHEDPSLMGMGSTLVALLINKDRATIAHLGDSRCYQMRGRKMVFRTNDHSLVGELVQYKTLTEEQARTSPQSNVITRALGATSNHTPEIKTMPYRKGDRFILCSDGVWGIMPQEQLLNRFSATPDINMMVENLSKEIDNIGFAADGHHDNHTLAVVDMAEDSNIQDKMTKSAKFTIAALAVLLFVSIIVNIVGIKSVETINLVQDDATMKEAAEQDRLFLESQIEVQLEQNKELEEQNNKLIAENERLQKLVDDAKKSLNQSASQQQNDQGGKKQEETQKQENKKQDEQNAKEATNKEAKQTAEAIIAQLDKMINFKFNVSKINQQGNARLKASRAAKAKIRNKAIELFTQLNRYTGGKFFDIIKKVKDQLSDPKPGSRETDCMLVAPDSSGKLYVSPVAAKQALEEIKKTITDEIITSL